MQYCWCRKFVKISLISLSILLCHISSVPNEKLSQYHRISKYAEELLATAEWIQLNNRWILANNLKNYFSNYGKCLHSTRVIFYGDSWCVQMYRTIARQGLPSSITFSSKYNYRMKDKENFGNRNNNDILEYSNVTNASNSITSKYCNGRGCGAGTDLAVCGRPGRDDLNHIAFSSKSFVDTPEWDNDTVQWALNTKASFIVLDVGRFGVNHCLNTTERTAWNNLFNQLSSFNGFIIAAGFNNATLKYNFQYPIIPFNYYRLRSIPSYIYMVNNGTVTRGHGGAGTVMIEYGKLLLNLLCYAQGIEDFK